MQVLDLKLGPSMPFYIQYTCLVTCCIRTHWSCGGETFPWELKVRKLNARDKGSVEVKGIQHLPPAPTPGKWVISLLRYVRHSEPLVLPRAS